MTVAELGAVLRWQGGGTGIVDVGDYGPPWFLSGSKVFPRVEFPNKPQNDYPNNPQAKD